MTQANRRFVKGLRYNLAHDRPLACMVAADTGATPTAMYISPPSATADYQKALDTLLASSAMRSWVWRASVSEMAALPPKV